MIEADQRTVNYVEMFAGGATYSTVISLLQRLHLYRFVTILSAARVDRWSCRQLDRFGDGLVKVNVSIVTSNYIT